MARPADKKSPEVTKKLAVLSGFNFFTFAEKVNKILSFVFYLVWILIGLFILLVVYSGIKQGAYKNLLAPKQEAPQSDVSNTSPAEVEIEGIGKINVECTQNALLSESIQKLVQSKDINSLSEEERKKFEECLVKESPTPPN